MVIQLAPLAAVQLQPVLPVTDVLAGPAVAGTLIVVGDKLNVQLPAAAWTTVKVLPAIVTVPVRVVVAAFAATVSVTVPLPEPLAPLATLIQLALLTAVHAQPAAVVTDVLSDPPVV